LTGSNLNSGISKLMCISADPRSLGALVADLGELPVVPAYSLPTVLEINLAGINKGDGAVALLDALGWGHVPLVAAGDGENDLELFDRAGQVFAPADSPPAIRARADHLIDVDRTGLLAPILEHIL